MIRLENLFVSPAFGLTGHFQIGNDNTVYELFFTKEEGKWVVEGFASDYDFGTAEEEEELFHKVEEIVNQEMNQTTSR